ncbi:membrane protein [Actinomadura sp. NBRC 104412]|nr:membrane protein [Actinomadura sp. NBRC 104412]
MIVAFSWPAARIAPRDVPIVTAGPQAAAVAGRLDRERPGAFEVTTVADEAAARAVLADYEAYGAIVTTPSGPKVLVASAASPMVAQLLTQVAQQLSGAPSAAVQDVVAADADDPRGAGFGALALPLIMSGIAAAVLLTFAIPALAARALGLVIFSILGGLGAAWLAQGWLSLLPGSYPTLASVMGLAVLAVAGTVAGLAAAIGRAGLGLGALTFLLLGNPLSAATSAPELLPQPWGELGQLLPPGAAITLVRSVTYFDGAGASAPLITLLAWAAAGLVLFGVGGLRSRTRTENLAEAEREPAIAS